MIDYEVRVLAEQRGGKNGRELTETVETVYTKEINKRNFN